MSTADVHNINMTFLDGVRLITGQKTAKLRSAVTVESVTGERQAIDQIGSTALQPKTTRNTAVPVVETARFRRWMEQKDYWNSERFDGFDTLRQKADPAGRLAQAWAAGAARIWDQMAISAALGNAYVGKQGSDAVMLPDSQRLAHEDAGMTLAKVRTAVKRLRRVNPDREDPITIFLTSEQESELLADTFVSSSDYYAGRPLMEASLPFFAGAHFLVVDDFLDLSNPGSGRPVDGASGTFEPALPLDDSGSLPVRTCFAALRSGVIMGELLPITTEINPAKDHGIFTQQLQVEMSVGGTREHESKVVAIDCVDRSPMAFG